MTSDRTIWYLRTLGGLVAEPCRSDLKTIARFRTQKAASLLTYLATHPGGQPREVLMTLLWPDVPPEAARNSLSVALSSLRHHLEPPGIPGGSVLEANRTSIGIHAGTVRTDVEVFLAAERAARASSLPAPERRAALQRAVESYSGPFLPGFYDDWVLVQRETLGAMFSDLLSELVRLLPPGEATQWLHHVSLRVPEHDIDYPKPAPPTLPPTASPSPAPKLADSTVTCVALSLLGATPDTLTSLLQNHQGTALLDGTFVFGRASAALVFALMMARLSLPTSVAVVTEETSNGTSPISGKSARLLLSVIAPGRIVCREATAVLARAELPVEAHLIDLGRWQLPTSGIPERLFEVQIAGVPQTDELALIGAQRLSLNTLPTYPTRFFGRTTEQERIRRLMSEARLVTVLGLGGMGKTRLALETLHPLAEKEEACYMVPLAHLTSGEEIPGAIRVALRLPSAAEEREQVVRALSEKPTVLLLDNLEQIDDSASDVVAWLLESVPSLRILATSRRALKVPGEKILSLAPLSSGTDVTKPVWLLQNSPAVALFCDRAQAALPDFQLTVRNAEAVVALCRRLEGIPLALELAASRARVLTPGQWLERLERGLEAVATTTRTRIPERHRTLLATLRWSYDLLPPDVQAFFTKLAVFQGGWDLDAAEAITDDPLALDHLATLGENSLLWSESSSGGPLRFRMLEIIREFALTLLYDDQYALRSRHAAYYTATATERVPSLKTSDPAHLWFDREQANLTAALEYTEKTTPDQMLTLAACVGRFWEVRGAYALAYQWLERALRANPVETEETNRDRATIHMVLGNIAHNRGEFDRAENYLSESLRLREAIGDDQGAAMALNNLSLIAVQRKDYESARALTERVIAVHRQGSNEKDAAVTQINLANLYAYTGDWAQAERLYQEAVPVLRQFQHQQALGVAYANLCACAANRGDLEEAELWARDSVNLKEELGDRVGLAQSLDTLSEVQFLRGDVAMAGTNLCQSIRLLQETSAWRTVPYALMHRAQQLQQTHPQKAARLLGAAERINREDGGVFPPYQSQTFQELETALGVALGPEALAAEKATGDRLDRNEAVALAID